MSTIATMNRLPVGVQVATEAVAEAASVHLGVWLRCGTRYETPADNGIAHFIEHMVFKGGPRYSAQALARAIEALGGQFDAYTTHEATCYTMQVLPEHVGQALELLAELIVGGEFDQAAVDVEQNVILEEILEADDSPSDLVNELCARQAWGAHPLALPVLGTAASVAEFDAARLTAYRRAHYTGDRTWLIGVGAVDAANLADLAGAAWRDLPPHSAPLVDPVPEFHSGLAAGRLEVDQVHLSLAAPAGGAADPDRYALWLLDALLGATMSSRLFQEVRENRGLAYQISSNWQTQRDTGLMIIEAAAHPGRITELLKVCIGEIERLLADGVTEEELAWAKSYSRATILLASESLGTRLARLARGWFQEGRRVTVEETIQGVAATTVEDVARATRRVFGGGEYVLSVVGPVTDKRAATWWKVVQA